ncbi:MAG: Protein of unknown function (DUF2029) [Rhodobacteraceae bacterium HLUCCA08]|nr:MAG: Protein of unknown function (DUF2029) [Rhodobacteraceae bacterium HLUCCA08]
MSRPNPALLAGFAILLIAALGGVSLLKGGLFVGKHEGDTLHAMQIVFRMAEGQVPHRDFMTPIGALAFWPIAALVQTGMGFGMAVLWSQVLVAIGFLVPLVWVAANRLEPRLAFLFTLIVMVLILALVHGEAQRSVSISMHYNRWAWAAAFVAILAAVIPPTHPRSGVVDGVVIGLMATIMVMIKVTYFAAFAVPIVVGLLLTGQRRALVVAVLTGLVAAAAITAFTGPEYWLAYLDDLRTVAGSEVRAAPGEPLTAIMGAPAYLGGSLLAVAGVILLRQARADTGGLVLLLLLPGFFYVTYQNFGNDPQWLLLVGVLLLALRPEAGHDLRGPQGWPMRESLGVVAAMALALSAPSFFNLAYSPFRHFRVDEAGYTPLLARGAPHDDIRSVDLRVLRVDGRIALDGPGSGLEAYRDLADRDAPSVFRGETFDYCTVELGLPSVMQAIADDLDAAGLAEGRRVFAADIFSSYWLFGSLEPLAGGAPWYYGGLAGWDDADYLLVPLCPVAQDVQRMILEDIEDAGADGLVEIRRTPLYVLFSRG